MTTAAHREVQELLGAYALDALDDGERGRVEGHLPTCPRCRAEVDDHLQVAGWLGSDGEPASEEVWTRVAAEIDPAPERVVQRPSFGTPGPRRWAAAAAFAGVAAALVVLGVAVVRQQDRIDEVADRVSIGAASQLADGLADVDASLVELAGDLEGDDLLVRVVVGGDGGAVAAAGSLVALADDRTYQLWGVTAADTVSLRVLGPDPDLAEFALDDRFDSLAITVERAGGADQPTAAPVVSGPL